MAHDMAVDFKAHNVCVISLWMGLLKAERSMEVFAQHPELYAEAAASAESQEFPGRVIAALAGNADLMSRSGKVWVGAELAQELGVVDVDGRQPHSHRSMFGNPPNFSTAVVQ